MATDMKEKFEIKNYVKLICLRLDHYESFIEDEVNVLHRLRQTDMV